MFLVGSRSGDAAHGDDESTLHHATPGQRHRSFAAAQHLRLHARAGAERLESGAGTHEAEIHRGGIPTLGGCLEIRLDGMNWKQFDLRRCPVNS